MNTQDLTEEEEANSKLRELEILTEEANSKLRELEILTEEANSKRRALEIEQAALYKEVNGYRLLKRSARILLSIGSQTVLRIADIYDETHRTNTGLIEPKPLMKPGEWRARRKKILTFMLLVHVILLLLCVVKIFRIMIFK